MWGSFSLWESTRASQLKATFDNGNIAIMFGNRRTNSNREHKCLVATLGGGWTNPCWNICASQIGNHCLNFRGENSKNIWVATTQHIIHHHCFQTSNFNETSNGFSQQHPSIISIDMMTRCYKTKTLLFPFCQLEDRAHNAPIFGPPSNRHSDVQSELTHAVFFFWSLFTPQGASSFFWQQMDLLFWSLRFLKFKKGQSWVWMFEKNVELFTIHILRCE